jgi:GT2 family glycosyltransferase
LLRERLRQGAGEPSRQDLAELADLLGAVNRHFTDLESRLSAIENSRFFQLLRLPGRLLLRWRGPGRRSDYRLWLEQEQAPVPRQLEHAASISVFPPAGGPGAGEYVAFQGRDDTLAPAALEAVAAAIEDHAADLLYTDEDHLDRDGRRIDPIFKPAWSPDLLRAIDYIGGLLVVRRERLEECGWEGREAPDLELLRRLAERVQTVVHIPRVLYHRRAKPAAPAVPHRAAATPEAKASIIICSRNAGLLGRCLAGIQRNTSHGNREIVVVHHQTGDVGAIRRVLEQSRVFWTPWPGAFHFAAMNNLGASKAHGDVLVFLNDDVEPLEPEWLAELVAAAGRPETGVVGAHLVYPSGAVQHAGIAIGIMQAAGHPCRDTHGSPYWKWLPYTRNVSAVTGACMAIRRSVFEELGGFDEAFPVNYNDVDLCLRARRAGYGVVLEPAARLRHHECRTRRPGVRLAELEELEWRWSQWLEEGDPFYSPHLDPASEAAALDLGPIDPARLHPRVWRRAGR